jgi:hypothetical protein
MTAMTAMTAMTRLFVSHVCVCDTDNKEDVLLWHEGYSFLLLEEGDRYEKPY